MGFEADNQEAEDESEQMPSAERQSLALQAANDAAIDAGQAVMEAQASAASMLAVPRFAGGTRNTRVRCGEWIFPRLAVPHFTRGEVLSISAACASGYYTALGAGLADVRCSRYDCTSSPPTRLVGRYGRFRQHRACVRKVTA